MNRAPLVAAGIMMSRVTGFIRLRAFAHYFGLRSDAADAFNAAFRIPTLFQSLFGEGALSASFIPVYAALVAKGERQAADRVAGAVFGLLAAVVTGGVALCVLGTPLLVSVVAPGFSGEKRELTVAIARVLFPAAGLMVLSAWCLGILNSHHRFLLSYASPMIWNAAMIATLLVYGRREPLPELARLLAWGSVVGCALQFAVQLPVIRTLAPGLRPSFDLASAHVRTIGRNLVPAALSRGVVQISAYIDALIASLLPTGAVTGLANAQLLYTLPVSLFGISVAASELPVMAGAMGTSGREAVRNRLELGLRRIAYFTVPSSVAFLALGDVIAGAVLQTGRFTPADAQYVWGILGGAAVGLVASTLGRLYSSTYYAMGDPRTPLRFACVRLALTTVLGYAGALWLPHALGIDTRWGAAGLTASAGVAGWVEMFLLRGELRRRIGHADPGMRHMATLWSAAVLAAAVGWTVKRALPAWHPAIAGGLVLVPFGSAYVALTLAFRVPEASRALRAALRR